MTPFDIVRSRIANGLLIEKGHQGKIPVKLTVQKKGGKPFQQTFWVNTQEEAKALIGSHSSKSFDPVKFEKDYQQIKQFFLTFNEKKKKAESVFNKAHEHIITMGARLATSLADGTISLEKYIQMQSDYGSHLKRVKEIGEKFHNGKINGIVSVLSQQKVGLDDLPDYGLSYGPTISKIYKKGETNDNEHWPAGYVQEVLEAITSIVGVKRMNNFQYNTQEVIGMNKQLEGNNAWTPEYNGEKILSPMIKVKSHVRAYCRWSVNHGRVVIGSHDGFSTMAHELGHYIEDTNPDIKAKAIAYVQKRTEGEKPIPLSQMTGNKSYKENEVCKPDKFIEPYTGKIYYGKGFGINNGLGKTIRATELISMWFTNVFKNPKAFIEKDEDHFKTVLKWFRE